MCVCAFLKSQGGAFKKLAILTKDTKGVADKVSASGGAKKTGGDVLFAGEVPGIGTKVDQTTAYCFPVGFHTPSGSGQGVSQSHTLAIFVSYDAYLGFFHET